MDTVVLGLATNPKGTVNGPVLKWINRLMSEGHQPYVPEIADYELRRELIRLGSKNAIGRLDGLAAALGYIPIDTASMRRAAELWAKSRAAAALWLMNMLSMVMLYCALRLRCLPISIRVMM
ncbi:MAG TPA: hypothetical protein V6D08_01920 [Candidatus Obscuribacterales bacterium]